MVARARAHLSWRPFTTRAHVRVVAARHPCAEEVLSVNEHVDLAVRSVARLEAQASGGAGPVNSLMAAITLVGRKEELALPALR